MTGLLGLSRIIDAFNTAIGRTVSWFILVAVIVSAGNAIVRKLFNQSSNALLEAQWYLFGAVFMLCAAYTFLKNEHIRIDIVSNLFSKRGRDWVDVIGHVLFLFPLCLIMMIYGFPFFWRSFDINEVSANAGGLIQWPAKVLIPLGFVLLFAQGISELIKRVAIMRGDMEDPHGHGAHHGAAAEAEAERLLRELKAAEEQAAPTLHSKT